MAEEQAALLAQIKALSDAIDQRKSSSSLSSHRGDNRGGYRGKERRIAAIAPPPSNARSSRHRTLVLSNTASSNGGNPASESSPLPAAVNGDSWVKRKSTHNMSLVSKIAFEKTEPARLAAIAATQTAKTAALQSTSLSPSKKGKSSNSVRRGDRMGEVIVDGVVFEFDESGSKLVKKDPQPTADENENSKKDTPLRTSVDGQKYIRTKTGNLISKELLEKRRESRKNQDRVKRLGEMGKDIASHQRIRDGGRKKEEIKAVRKSGLCSFYNKTGQCKRGLSCPYTHDPAKVAICPGILRLSGCVLSKGSCPLSHDKKPERMPHCVHFLRLGSCQNGDKCDYTHPDPQVKLTNESSICIDFSDLGWCGKSSRCSQRHTWDCPELLRKGSCCRKGCKLMHVIRGDKNLKQREEGEELELADDELFVRDDEAADLNQKRKREEEEESQEARDRELSPTWKAKRTKEFSRQQDFISFANENRIGGSLEEDEVREKEAISSDDSDEHESVHSDSSEEEDV